MPSRERFARGRAWGSASFIVAALVTGVALSGRGPDALFVLYIPLLLVTGLAAWRLLAPDRGVGHRAARAVRLPVRTRRRLRPDGPAAWSLHAPRGRDAHLDRDRRRDDVHLDPRREPGRRSRPRRHDVGVRRRRGNPDHARVPDARAAGRIGAAAAPRRTRVRGPGGRLGIGDRPAHGRAGRPARRRRVRPLLRWASSPTSPGSCRTRSRPPRRASTTA